MRKSVSPRLNRRQQLVPNPPNQRCTDGLYVKPARGFPARSGGRPAPARGELGDDGELDSDARHRLPSPWLRTGRPTVSGSIIPLSLGPIRDIGVRATTVLRPLLRAAVVVLRRPRLKAGRPFRSNHDQASVQTPQSSRKPPTSEAADFLSSKPFKRAQNLNAETISSPFPVDLTAQPPHDGVINQPGPEAFPLLHIFGRSRNALILPPMKL